MSDIEDLVLEIDERYPSGVVRRDGSVTGAWFVSHPDPRGYDAARRGRSFTVTALWRREGGVGACEAVLDRGSDVAGWILERSSGPAALRGPAADGFGHALLALLDIHGEHRRIVGWDVPRDVREAVADIHLARRGASTRDFLSTLDPEALRLVDWLRGYGPHMLGRAWPAMDRSFSPDAPLATLLRDRPAFARILLTYGAYGADAVRPLLDGRVLDRAIVHWATTVHKVPRSFMPVMADAETCTAGIERRLGPASTDGRLANLRLMDRTRSDWAVAMARRAAGFPREWAPSGPAQWEAFVDLGPVVDQVMRWTTERGEMVKLVNSGGDWVAFRSRLYAAAGLEASDDILESTGLEGAAEDIGDMAKAYARDVLKPACAATTGFPSRSRARQGDWEGAAWALLNSGRSLPRMLEASRDWHRGRAGMARDKATMPTSLGDVLGWAKGLPEAVVGGIEFVILADEAALADEGREGTNADGSEGLMNCVDGRWHECLSGLTRIVSLRVPGAVPPERLSVAEVATSFGRDGPAVHVVEHKGHGNGPPSAACEAALSAYVEAVASGRLPVDFEGLEPVPVSGDDVGLECRFDWTDVSSRARVRRAWDRIVPPALRDMPEEDLALLALDNLRDFHAWSATAATPGRHAAPDPVREWDDYDAVSPASGP